MVMHLFRCVHCSRMECDAEGQTWRGVHRERSSSRCHHAKA